MLSADFNQSMQSVQAHLHSKFILLFKILFTGINFHYGTFYMRQSIVIIVFQSKLMSLASSLEL